ncbi:MAG: LysM peptidoglycan-binding domain-containing protein [Proteobacteria bacterium]|nr:LysM peptidoglycan-binding domain-containing protein [Pseudomonadota bacterium]MDE3208066.1 LysM peptidoglycan-binding domain-containing protein [Pseudomonadota bacterium]
MKSYRLYIIPFIIIASLLFCVPSDADVKLRANHPSTYQVKKGDNLWKIAGVFLLHPWQWPKIWHINPSIRNPNLIYPGDVLVLVIHRGKPEVELKSIQSKLKVIKLFPVVKSLPQASEPVPGFSRRTIAPFVSHSLLMSVNYLHDAPEIIHLEHHHLVGTPGSILETKGLSAHTGQILSVYRIIRKLRDPESQHLIGFEAGWLGYVRVLSSATPVTVRVLYSTKEIEPGDKLVIPPLIPQPVSPHSAHIPFAVKIVAMANGDMGEAATDSVVVLDRGADDGLDDGAVLMVHDSTGSAQNPDDSTMGPSPDGGSTLYVFHAFAHLSYAIVTHAVRPIKIGSMAFSPNEN